MAFHKLSLYCQVLLVFLAYLLGVVHLWRCRHLIRKETRRISAVYIAGLLLLGIYQVVFFLQKLDLEGGWPNVYVEGAKSILMNGSFGHLPRSWGWAALIFFGSFVLGEISTYTGQLISQALGCGSIIGIFFLSLWSGLPSRGAFICSVFFAIIPSRLACLMASTSHAAYLFFAIWAAAFSFLFYRTSIRAFFHLAGVFWILTILSRAESVVLLLLLFIAGAYCFLPKEGRKDLPLGEFLFLALALLTPLVISTWREAYRGDWMSSESQIGLNNFLYNISHYGMDFLWGRAHPVPLTLFAFIGAGVKFAKDRRGFWFLTGWLAVLALTYFSMWLQTYGESKDFSIKMWVLMFFYPPFLLFAATGMIWLSEKLPPSFRTAALFLVSGVLAAFFILNYSQHDSDSNQTRALAAAMRDVPLAVGCYSDAYMTDPLRADEFLKNPVRRRKLFSSVERVYLVESSGDSEADVCSKAIALIKENGRAVLVKQVDQGDVKYKIYMFAFF